MKSIFNRFLSVLCLLFVGIASTFAERISLNDAALVANNFMNVPTSQSGVRKSVADKRMVLKTAPATQEENQFYVYENANGEGWVMVAANDIAHPILAYSDEGQFRFDNQPSNVKCWLGKYNKQIKQAEENGVLASEEVTQEWKQLRKGTGIRKGTPVVAALIKTKWDQDDPYWNLCPMKGSSHDCYTGCVATAMAQVMYYWKWPVTGTGSYSYSTETLGLSASADFANTTYDWDNMLEKYNGYYPEGSGTWTTSGVPSPTTAQKNAVATLMYHCGVAVEMDYNVASAGGSGAQTVYPNANNEDLRCAQNALWQHFGYKKSTIKGYYRPGGYGYSTVSDANWHNYLKTELDAARPIMYAGADNEGGHSFICDGYDNTTPTRKYHFNWGWSGYCDGYYDVDNLVPGTGGSGAGNGSYNDEQDIIVGIIPDKPDVTVKWNVQGSETSQTFAYGASLVPSVSPADCSGGKKFVGWTKNSTITDGNKPSDLFTSGTKSATEATTYYAVYATASGSGGGGSSTGSKTFTFSSIASANGWTNGEAYTSVVDAPVTITAEGGGNNGKWYTSSGGSWRMYSGGTVRISVASGSVTSVTSSPSCSFSISNDEATFSPTARTDFTSITVNYSTSGGSGTTYSDYSLTCTTCTLTGITLNTSGVTTSFTVGDSFTSEGLVVTAKYSDCSDRTVSPTSVSAPDMTTTGSKTVTVTYTETGVTKTETYEITVEPAPTYTIRFFDGTTQIGANQEVTSGQSATKPSDPADCTDNGYTFVGWYTSKLADDNTTVTSGWITDFTATKDQDYYAVYSHTEDGGGGSSSTDDVEFNFGYSNDWGQTSSWSGTDKSTVTQTKDGVTVTHSRGSGSMYANTTSTRFYKDNTLSFSVTAGSMTSIVFTCSTYQTDITSNVGTCTATDSEFSWSGDATTVSFTRPSNASSYAQFSKATITISSGSGSSTTYYTGTKNCVTPTEVTITFHKNDGSDATISQTIPYNTATALTANTFSRIGYDFIGWATSASGTKAYDDLTPVTLTKNTNLYALWQKKNYNVTFTPSITNGTVTVNSNSTSPQSAEFESTVTVTVTPAAGYVFGTLVVKDADNNTITLSGEGNTRTFTMPASDVSVTATVTAIPTYNAVWSVNGSTTTQTAIAGTKLSELTPAIPEPTSASCDNVKVFVGWTTNPDFDGSNADHIAAIITSTADLTMPASDITYYAVFATESGSSSSNEFTLYTGELTAGDYLLVYDDGAMNTTVTSDRLQYTAVSPSSNTITTTDATLIWHIAASGEYWTIYNAGESKYAASTGAKNKAQLLDDGTDDKALWSCSSTSSSETYDFVNKQNTTNEVNATLRRNGDFGFACYATGTGGELSLYKNSSSASYSDYAVSCTTYTVTATTNNASLGTVAVDHYTITASPKTGYVADGYSITEGTATVTQNGNIYTVHPSSDCTVQINFRAAASYAVTLIDNGKTYTETAYEGTPYALPEEHKSTCPDATFLGWANGEYTNHATGTSTNPGYTAGGADVDITANTTFTAVYATQDGEPTDNYVDITNISDLTTGDYILATISTSHTSAWPMKNVVTDNHMGEETVSVSSGVITTTNSAIIWHIAKSGSNYTIYNSAIDKYLALSTTSPLLQSESHTFSAVYDDRWIFESNTVTGYQLSSGTITEYFESATSQKYIIHLFKRQVATSYTSHPNCCHEPANPLTITSDAGTFVGSGVAHLTLEGGNNQNITWSTTGGTLSNQSNTGATLTLSTPGTYTVTATQLDDESDPDNVICGAVVSVNITVKPEWTITLKIKDNGTASTYETLTVTDGESYTLPDLSDDYTCESGFAFAGWAKSESATSVEELANAVITASESTTWWAVWKQSGSSSTETRTRYSLVTNASSLSANDVFVLTYNNFAHGQITSGEFSPNATCDNGSDAKGAFVTFASTETPQLFTLKGTNDAWKLYTGSQYVQFDSKKYALVDAVADATACTIAIASDKATISDGSYAIRYNTTSPRWYSTSSTSLQLPKIYKQDGTVTIDVDASVSYTVNNTGCENGAIIRADGNQWITAANGQKVKTIIPVIVKNFETAATLTVTSSNPDFTASLEATSVPVAPAQLNTNLIVEYQPNYSNNSDNTTITLTAGEVTKNITVNGRSLPDEFLMIAKKTLWYAVPANMNEGEGQYNGVTVVPNDGSEPDNVPVAPSTVVYSLKSVASARYETAGQYVRLAGLGNKGLWANGSSSKTSIYNNAAVGESNDGHYEWQLVTTDGIHYSISNPAHPDAAAGRKLALGGAGGVQYGLYKESTIFFLVPAGCTSQPQEVKVSPRRTDATFSWVSNASSLTIDVYTNEEMTEGHLQSTAKSSPYMMMGLTEDTKYWFKLTPEGSDACSVTGNFKTTGPVIDVVEWEENAAIIFVDKDEELKPRIVIDGEVEHGAGSGATATDLFFSKYFEGAGDMKLVAIFNGTTSDISLAEYSLYTKNCGAPKKEADIATSTFGSTTTYPISALGTIKANQEIIFFTRPSYGDTPASCSGDFLNEKATHSGEDENPRWIECNNSTYYGGSKFPLMTFNGNDAICLEKNSSLIDVIGSASDPGKVKNCANRLNDLGWAINVKNIDYGKTVNDASFADLYDASSLTPTTDVEKKAILNGFGVDLDNEYINLTSARCILFRDKRVTSGDSAVLMNTGADFVTCTEHIEAGVTYLSEWNGRAVCMDAAMQTAAGVSDDGQATCNSYQDLGIFNYSEYYKDWSTILPGVILDDNVHDPEAKTYEIEIPELAKYSCLNLKFQLTDPDNVEHVYTEQEVQVPILVKDEHTTVDQIFNSIVKTDGGDPLYDESIQRCQTCDVVVLGGGLLTKATDGTTHDAPEIGNLKVYPGGKVVVPEGTTYTVNSLALRRQEDALSLAQVEGTLAIKQPNSTFLDIRIDPSNWHYFTLPYDVNVSDIKFVDGTPAAIGTDFRIGTYDGEHRAATQSASWVYLNSEDVLKAGLGYIIGLPGSGKVQRELRFPMVNEVITAEKEDKDIAGFHAWGGDKSDEELRPNHKGWNLLGAPYLTYYHTSLQTPLPTGELIHDPDEDPWQGHWVRNDYSLRYIVVPVDNGRSEYEQVNIANYHMAPFTSYFVQIGGSDPAADQTISYTASQAGKLSIVRRAVQEEVEDNHEVWFGVELVNADGLKDETALLISDKFTDDYDIMDDLVKMRGQYYQYAQITTKPVLASRNLKGEMAFNALPDSTAAAGVPLNFFAAKDGDYRFTISGNYPLDEVKSAYLYDNDNATQKWHNLMESDYTFTTKRGDNTTRFMLAVTVERKQPEITTALDNMSSKLTLTTINRTLVLSGLTSESDIYVYDVSGKLLSTGQYNASASGVFRTTVENAGVYFVRVCSKDGQQTLQTIVY